MLVLEGEKMKWGGREDEQQEKTDDFSSAQLIRQPRFSSFNAENKIDENVGLLEKEGYQKTTGSRITFLKKEHNRILIIATKY